MKIWIEDRKYYMHLRAIKWMKYVREAFGWFNSLFIDNSLAMSGIKIHKWQLKFCKCVTPDDFYIVTGIYRKLLKTKRCDGYTNFGITDGTYKDIEQILCDNYKWDKQTMFGGRDRSIRFTWMNYSPISLDWVDDWWLVWYEDDVRNL